MTQTAQQYAAFRLSVVAGLVRDIAVMRGGTGYKRRALTQKEREHKRIKRQMTKRSRRLNRQAA